MKVLRSSFVLGWLSFVLSVALLWVQHQAGVLHPQAYLFVFLLVLTLLSSLCGLGTGLHRFVRGPARRAGLVWGVGAFGPFLVWLGLAGYVQADLAAGWAPTHPPMTIVRMAGASVIEAQVGVAYPYRLESEHLVMFYGDHITTPERDMDEMNKHVAHLVAQVGKPLRAKIHWIRGPVLGLSKRAFYGLALGSDFSPRDWDTADHPRAVSVDRHELAHAVMFQFYEPDTDPPFLLVEGWGEFHSGSTTKQRAKWAMQSRQIWIDKRGGSLDRSYLRELVGPDWYYRIAGPIYSVGGAFTDYLVQTYGTERFLSFYFACRPDNFETVCQAELGVDLDTLEAAFWLWASGKL